MATTSPVRFDAPLEPLAWGRSTYVVIMVPQALVSQATDGATRRVEGTIESVPVNVGLNRADVLPESFIYVGPALRRRLGAKPGDVVECVLAPADPDHVPVPDDVHEALHAAGRLDAFERRRSAERRRLLMPVENAVRPATRTRRIIALVASLPPE